MSQGPSAPWDSHPGDYEYIPGLYDGDATSSQGPFSVGSFSSPTTGWQTDYFARDPGYVAFREELRDLIFHAARTAPPSPSARPRSESPLSPSAAGEVERAAQRQTTKLLSHGRHLEYLKNYVSDVAPWVCIHLESAVLMLL